jgi:hypothetical protein
MHALRDGRGDTLRGDQKGRQLGRQLLCAVAELMGVGV